MVGVLVVLLGAFLSMLDFFVVNVSLESIQTDLHTSSASLELVVAGYGIAYAVLLVLGGRLGDAFGRRRLFLAGMVAFGITSLLCGLAPTTETLVLGRALQGVSAAAMVPQVLATIQAATHGRHRARAISLYGAMGGIASVAGQLLGGVLVSANLAGTEWRPIFLINIPVVIVGLILARRILPETRSSQSLRLDIPGTALLAVSLLLLLIPLSEGRAEGWPRWSWAMLAAVPFAAAAFFAVERRMERSGGLPLVPPSLLKVSSVRTGLALGVPFFAGFGGFMFVLAVSLQQVTHHSALQAGLVLVPMGAGMLVSSMLTPRLLNRYGRRVITAGALIVVVGLAAVALTALNSWSDLSLLHLAPGMAIAGFGNGLVMAPLFSVVLSQVPAERAGVGTGVLITMQQASLSLGVAVMGGIFLSLSQMSSVGPAHAFAVVLGIQALAALAIVVAGRRLPARVG
jgi:EmrB/QacA subfamily drug resistance transporter